MEDVPHDAIVRSGLVEPVATGGADERLWLDCDLASLAEHRLGDPTDPRALTPERRELWVERATSDGCTSLAARRYERCYWLLEGAVRVGTIALSEMTYGLADVRVSSFYVLPTLRGRGVGRCALDRLAAALAAEGFGFRLDTAWSWRRTVRFYQRAGLWVFMWKRDLTLVGGRGLPAPVVDVGEREATLAVMKAPSPVVLASARYEGDRLAMELAPKEIASDPALGDAYWHAASTLALALAMEGKPLVRSPEAWARCRHADAGAPEGLAQKITVWEAFDRAQGWRVEQPRIPGLEYPTWEAFEARWEAERAAFDAELAAAARRRDVEGDD